MATVEVFPEARQCSCGAVDVAWDEDECPPCARCGSDDEPASCLPLTATVTLDADGDVNGDVVLSSGYTDPGWLAGSVYADQCEALSPDMERDLVERAREES